MDAHVPFVNNMQDRQLSWQHCTVASSFRTSLRPTGAGAHLLLQVAPWSKTGGLGDVVGGLPIELVKRGHSVMTVAPR